MVAVILGVVLVAAALLLNVWTLTALFQPVDGSIDPSQERLIWAFDVACLVGAALLVRLRPRIRIRTKYVAFSLVPAIVLLAGAEVVARVVAGSPAQSRTPLVVEDDVLHHKWAPNLDIVYEERGTPYRLRANTQSWLEDYDVSVAKPPGVFRIFYVGDSTTAGVVRKEGRLPDLVEARLNAAKSTSRAFEVINTGTSTFSTISYYMLVRDRIVRYAPDLVVLQFDMTDVPNDLEYWPCTVFDASGLPVRTRRPCSVAPLTPHGRVELTLADQVKGWLVAHSAVFRLANAQWLKFDAIWAIRMTGDASDAAQAVQLQRVAPTALPADWVSLDWTPEIEANVQRSMRVLAATIRLLRERGVAVVVTGVPHCLQYTGEWSTRPHTVLAETAQANGALYLNSYEALASNIRGSAVDEYYWLVDNTHFNERGNGIWADAQVRFLTERGLVDVVGER